MAQINITHILRYSNNFPDSIYLGPPSSSPTPLSLRIRVLSSKNSKRRSTYSVSICRSVLFSYTKKTYHSNHIEVFEREIQPYEIVKSLCESVVVLELQICLMFLIRNFSFSINLCKKKKR